MLVLTLIAAVLLSNVAFAKTKIVQWSFPMLENEMEVLWKPFIEKFNEIYPDIEVQVEILPWAGRDERMLTAVVSGNPPDVVYLNEFFLQTFASRGALEPLNAYISEEVLLSRFPETLLSTGKVGDNYYLAPMLTGVLGNVYHRKSSKKQAGISTTCPKLGMSSSSLQLISRSGLTRTASRFGPLPTALRWKPHST